MNRSEAIAHLGAQLALLAEHWTQFSEPELLQLHYCEVVF